MKVIVVARRFDGIAGGVQRSASFLLNLLAARGHVPVLLTWDRGGACSFYDHDCGVVWEKLDDGGPDVQATWLHRLRRLWRIRRLIRGNDPDVVVAFQHGPFLAVAVSLLMSAIPVVAAERNAPTRFDYTQAGRRRNWIFASFLLARRVIVQFDRYHQLYPWYLRRRLATVANAIPQPGPDDASVASRPGILFVGRFSYQKAPESLVRAFALLHAQHPDWRLRLVGAGEGETDLRQLVAEQGIAEAVEFAGTTRDVNAEYAAAAILCLPSLWEGFPNVAGEAMAHGLPVVGFSDCAGLRDLVRDGEEGVMVAQRDERALMAALDHLVRAPQERTRLGEGGRRRAADYQPETVARRWMELLGAEARGR